MATVHLFDHLERKFGNPPFETREFPNGPRAAIAFAREAELDDAEVVAEVVLTDVERDYLADLEIEGWSLAASFRS